MNALLQRLDEMALRLQSDPSALALLALGSVGRDVHRLDEHSDLDFFVITDDKRRLLEDVSWLGSPIEWLHRNTRDGYKALVAGIYHEFAVLTPEELPGIPFAPGRVVWARPAFDVSLLTPAMSPPPSAQWLVDEVLSNLYVGLHRWLRGERLAAMQIVQGEALTNALRIRGGDDPYNSARRAELSNSVEWPELAGGMSARRRLHERSCACYPRPPRKPCASRSNSSLSGHFRPAGTAAAPPSTSRSKTVNIRRRRGSGPAIVGAS